MQEKSKAAFDALIVDLTDRYEFVNVWHGVEEEVREEMEIAWIAILKRIYGE